MGRSWHKERSVLPLRFHGFTIWLQFEFGNSLIDCSWLFPGEDPRNFWVLPVMFAFSRLEFGKWRKAKNTRAVERDTDLSLFGSMSQIWFRIRRKIEGVESWVEFLSLGKHAMDEWPKIKCFSMCLNILVPENFGMSFSPLIKPNQTKPIQKTK